MMSQYVTVWHKICVLKTNESKKHLLSKEFKRRFAYVGLWTKPITKHRTICLSELPGAAQLIEKIFLLEKGWSLVTSQQWSSVNQPWSIRPRSKSSCCLGLWFAFGTVRTTRTTSAESTIIQAQKATVATCSHETVGKPQNTRESRETSGLCTCSKPWQTETSDLHLQDWVRMSLSTTYSCQSMSKSAM